MGREVHLQLMFPNHHLISGLPLSNPFQKPSTYPLGNRALIYGDVWDMNSAKWLSYRDCRNDQNDQCGKQKK
jgi:hypothetical protein